MVSAAFSFGYIAAFLWGVYGIARGSLTFGVMTAFLQLVGQVQRPVVNLARQIPSFIYSTTSIDRLMEMEDAPKEAAGEPVKLAGAAGIRVEGLDYRYPDGKRMILKGLTFDFPPLSRTAIVGETGSGKSTLIRLMLALLKPVDGKVVLYDESREVPASAATRCNLVYVPQGNTLFSGSVRENLLMGDPHPARRTGNPLRRRRRRPQRRPGSAHRHRPRPPASGLHPPAGRVQLLPRSRDRAETDGQSHEKSGGQDDDLHYPPRKDRAAV